MRRREFSACCGLILATASMPAQCELVWESAGGYPGANAIASATTTWDPDGAGPSAELVVVGGSFTIAGTVVANRVACFDPATGAWSALGSGVGGPVRATLALPNGDLVVAGTFWSAGGVAAANVARWDGASWQPLGLGLGGPVHALARLPNGDIVAGGEFAVSGLAGIARIARWDGTSWHPFGSGCSGPVYALAVAPNGDVVAGGSFLTAGGQPVARIAKWSNGAWSGLSGGCNDTVRGVAVLPSGNIVAAGQFTQVGLLAIPRVAQWNGFGWSAMGLVSHAVSCLQMLPNGDLFIGTSSIAGTYTNALLRRWRNGVWEFIVEVGSGNLAASVLGCCVDAAGDLTVVGDFRGAPGYSRASPNILRIVGGQVQAQGVDGAVHALAVAPSGQMLATGAFDAMGVVGGIDAWNGVKWQPIHAHAPESVALAGLANGSVLAAGAYPGAYTYPAALVSASAVVIFGFSWCSGTSIARMPDGTYYLAAAVQFGGWHMMRVDAQGAVMGQSIPVPLSSAATAMVVSPSGDLFAACGYVVWRRTGLTWSQLGSAFDAPCRSVLLTKAGELVVGGDFTSAGASAVSRLARWDGSAWQALGSGCSGPVHDVVELPNGDLLVGGLFTTAGGVAAANLARWNGVAWSAVSGGTNGRVKDLQIDNEGAIWVGGEFTRAGSTLGCGFVARLVPSCPASVSSYGTACTGSGGVNTLQATSLPWVGGTFASRVTGMPAMGLALAAYGLVPASMPLHQVVPNGQVGCDLLAWPILYEVGVMTAGTADFTIGLPAANVFVGQSIYQQVVGMEFDSGGAWVNLTSSNGLALTVGSY